MPIIIMVLGTATDLWPEPRYVESHDHSLAPADSVVLTADRAKAERFKDTAAAMGVWKGVNQQVPVRPDGQPNRPLSAYTVELRRVSE